MATQTFNLAYDDDLWGNWTDTGSGVHAVGERSALAKRITGTDATITFTAGGSFQEVSVDGGAFSNLTAVGSVLTLFSGLSDAAHDVILRGQAGRSATNLPTFSKTTPISVTGAAPAVASHPDSGPFEAINAAEFAAKGLTNSPMTTAVNGYSPNPVQLTPFDGCVIRKLRASTIKVWCRGGASASLTVYRDGTLVGNTAITSSTWGWVTVASGQDENTEAEYAIISSGPGGTFPYVYSIMAFGGAFSADACEERLRIACLGDSTTVCSIGTGATTAQGWVQKLIARGYLMFNRGVSGNKISAMDTRWATDVAAISDLDAVIFVGGANAEDTGQNQAANAELARPYVASIIDKAVAYSAELKLFVGETYPSASGQRQGTMLSEEVADEADARVTYHDTDGWFNPTSGQGTHDGTHLNATGGTAVADEWEPIIEAAFPVTSPNLTVDEVGDTEEDAAGTVYQNSTRSYTLRNTGDATLEDVEVTLGAGLEFQSLMAEGLDLAPAGTATLTIKFPNLGAVEGEDGLVTISSANDDDYTFTVTATVEARPSSGANDDPPMSMFSRRR